jgi:hypothetical protein
VSPDFGKPPNFCVTQPLAVAVKPCQKL